MLHDKLGNHRLKGFAGAFDFALHHVRDAIRYPIYLSVTALVVALLGEGAFAAKPSNNA